MYRREQEEQGRAQDERRRAHELMAELNKERERRRDAEVEKAKAESYLQAAKDLQKLGWAPQSTSSGSSGRGSSDSAIVKDEEDPSWPSSLMFAILSHQVQSKAIRRP